MSETLTEAQRYPLLTEKGRRLLYALREDAHAPRWSWFGGDRLGAQALQRVREYGAQIEASPPGWSPQELPPWVKEYATFCLREVPFYHRLDASPDNFATIPTTSRADLAREPWYFVPEGQPLDDLIVWRTSGTTGHPIQILSHPETCGKYLPLLCQALAGRGVKLEEGPDRVAIIYVVAQKQARIGPMVISYLGEAGFARVNLHPDAWRDPRDCIPFLQQWQPQIFTGDPIAFDALAKLPLRLRSKALVSSGQALNEAFRQQLETHFGCPVIDMYSVHEAGIIAAGARHGHQILPPDLYVEILDQEDCPCPPGTRGEITLTGGRNPFLPLLRYRTGDWASLEFDGLSPILIGLEGREPVVFRSSLGEPVNSVDVSTVLQRFSLVQFTLLQAEDSSLRLGLRGENLPYGTIRQALLELFGPDQDLRMEEMQEQTEGKVIQYSSAL